MLAKFSRLIFVKQPILRLNQARNIFSLSTITSSKLFHKIGILSAFGVVTGAVMMSPLEEFEKVERSNDAYHHHLHPR
jgi:hypothetical protein